jgi:Heavy metal binding domain
MRRSSSAPIVAARILLLLAAAATAVVGFVLANRDEAAVGESALAYVCPMHPEVRASSPDAECPICHMALVPRKGAKPAPPARELRAMHDSAHPQRRVSAREMRAPAWVEGPIGVALLYRDEVLLLAPEEEGQFVPAAGGPAVKVRLAGEPATPRDGSTALVRFRLDSASAPAPHETGWLTLMPRIRKDLEVPYSAIIQSPAGPYVLLVGPDKRTLTKRPIEIGRVLFGYAAVVSGLDEPDSIASMNTFFLDAERRDSGDVPP